ncbi:MAG: phage head closure protein [Rhodobacteraceae bacterium]|uniref:Head-tail adaptor protein n=1 Tax=Roseovarius nubinhibens TaxID=314263 RepID=A0A348W756_9RHOB|nr:phage head closure protein [Paracoccaceae bacterium]HAR50368.1 head-tail adaptor protein [Roseovarius nubinhibens]|tara:strand:- start:25496 stop:25840 length:345 start_codon:yes stop_codon:yes gene_type:complete
MAKPKAGELKSIVQFERYTTVDDGFGKVENWSSHGDPVRARKTEVSDGERWRASEVGAVITARFLLRWSVFTAGITAKDRLICEGRKYEITGGPREVHGRRRYVELSCAARSDK